jgi:rhodanese-related sulfurtransferase
MKKGNRGVFWGLAFVLLFVFITPVYGADDIPRISVKELNEIIDSPDLAILDVRIGRDWNSSDKKVIGAVRVDPKDISSWAGDYAKEQKIVLYCA